MHEPRNGGIPAGGVAKALPGSLRGNDTFCLDPPFPGPERDGRSVSLGCTGEANGMITLTQCRRH
jgi:hypothetical protein